MDKTIGLATAIAALALPIACMGQGTGAVASIPASGTAADARAMLDRVVVAMTADPVSTVSRINRGEADFRDRDLYPTCAGPDGKNVARPIRPGSVWCKETFETQ